VSALLALLSPRVWIAVALALALAAGYWKAYHSGYKARDAIAQVEEAERTAAALEASEQARAKEQELTRQIETERGKYAQQLKNTRTVAAAAGVGMRELQAALAPAAAASASATARADDAARARIVVGACAAEVQTMAAILDERNQQLIGLQAYVAAIRQNK
jgi:hypothetical protein